MGYLGCYTTRLASKGLSAYEDTYCDGVCSRKSLSFLTVLGKHLSYTSGFDQPCRARFHEMSIIEASMP